MVVIAITMILTSVAVIHYSESQLRAREVAAIQHLHTFEKAQAQYYGVYRRYAVSFGELEKAVLIPEHLAKGKLGGYNFELRGEPDSYVLAGRPSVYGKSGRRSFRVDETLVIRQTEEDRAAAEKDPPL
jgi:type II secretory pathway pseudopilin PulG